ncbi:MAG: nitrite reductase small subunit NirD [Janthinobacterium lividum]
MANELMTRWTEICDLAAIPRLGSRVIQRPIGNVAVFRTASDEVFALLDHCPHKGGALSQGIVHGSAVTCPLHSWTIELETGAARLPDEGCARRFPTKLDGQTVFVCLD